MPPQSPESFAQLERNLQAWLERATLPSSQPQSRPTEPILLRMFEERLKRLQAYVEEAESRAEHVLAPLGDEIAALGAWGEKLHRTRAKVVECTVRGV
jgi:hypothetical protein